MHAHTPLSPSLLLLVLRALVIINNYYYYYWVTYARIPVCLSAGVCLACGETWWTAGRAAAAAAAAGGRRLGSHRESRVRKKETPEKISSSVPFDIQNKLEIIQRWRREDELWESRHGFFFVKQKKKKREKEREMKKMAKAPLSCKFKCGRDVPANLNVRSLDGQRHTKHGQGEQERRGEGKGKLTPMDTHQGLDMKKRPGQANGQCGAGEGRGGGLRRRQTRPPWEGRAEGRGRWGRGPTSGRSKRRGSGVAGREERGGGGGGGGEQDVRPAPPPHVDPKMKDYLKFKKQNKQTKNQSVRGGCRGRGSAGGGKPGRVAPGHPPACAHPLPLSAAAALAPRVRTPGAEAKALRPRLRSGNFARGEDGKEKSPEVES